MKSHPHLGAPAHSPRSLPARITQQRPQPQPKAPTPTPSYYGRRGITTNHEPNSHKIPIRTRTPHPRFPTHPPNMSIIQQHTAATLSDAWRTIDIDALEADSCANFDTATLQPASGLPETSEADARAIN